MEISFNPIPNRIKSARVKKSISQKELGIRIGLDENSASSRMNHYEKGRHTPDVLTLKRIADELGVPLAYFFCESDLSAELNCLINEMSEEEKTKLLTQLQNKNET